ncbi:MAG: helix-turn-helix transcriptional regulator [Actinobacteria bacterium]|nr:helix-turn-helix transcriptional regulator [Actinomycetota bacterium]
MSVKEILGNRLRQIRTEKGLPQSAISDVLGYKTSSYVSDVEKGKFIPQPEKLYVWGKVMGMTKSQVDDLVVDVKMEDIGLSDPGFTLMFKEVPNMTADEKESVINAYEAVIKARSAKGKKKS